MVRDVCGIMEPIRTLTFPIFFSFFFDQYVGCCSYMLYADFQFLNKKYFSVSAMQKKKTDGENAMKQN